MTYGAPPINWLWTIIIVIIVIVVIVVLLRVLFAVIAIGPTAFDNGSIILTIPRSAGLSPV